MKALPDLRPGNRERSARVGSRSGTAAFLCTEAVHIPVEEGIVLAGDLTQPLDAVGIVLFAHGSGSSRHSSRNQFVAGKIHEAGVATLLFDLLSRAEENEDSHNARFRFDVDLLARRLAAATEWIAHHATTRHLGIGYFGASTGGAAALVAAAELGEAVNAVVTRGGRPDLAGTKSLAWVKAPTLFIVGGCDDLVVNLNYHAFDELRCTKQLVVVPRATHLFEEPGTLDRVATLAANWFSHYLKRP